MASGDKIKWEDADFKWEKAPTLDDADRYTWDLVVELALGVVGGIVEPAVEALAPEKKKNETKASTKNKKEEKNDKKKGKDKKK